MGDMLEHAYQHKYAVGAFDVVSMDFVAGVLAAAEQQQAPSSSASPSRISTISISNC
jgi:fructose/tagatose bisphosphate aldolase